MYGAELRSGIPDYKKINGSDYRWPNNRLPYKFYSNITSSARRTIKKAIAKFNFEMSGCFKIV